MSRLPQPGADVDDWGSILNDFLQQEHLPDGSLRLRSDGTLNAYYKMPASGIPLSSLSDDTQSSITNSDTLVVNVKKFGASGTGSGDDTSAIQAAIDSITSGGIVYFPQGTYLISLSLSVSMSNVTLRGSGLGSTIMVGNSSNANGIEVSGAQNITISDLQINGNRANQTQGVTYTDRHGVHLTNGCDNVRIENCYIHDTESCGIYAENSTNVTIFGNRVHNTGDGGIFLHPQGNGLACSNVTIANNTVDMAGFYGITAIKSDYVVITGNNSYNNGQIDISQGFGIDLEGSRFCTISGNVTHDSNGGIICRLTTEGGVSQRCRNVSIVGNTCYNTGTNGADAILADDSDYIVISGNSVLDSTCGITIGNATHTLIASNNVNNNSSTGIKCYDQTGSDCMITGNYVFGNGSDGITIAIPFTQVVGNKIRNNTGEGIHFQSGSSGAIAQDNFIYDNTDNGILIDSTNTAKITISNNHFDNTISSQGRAIYEVGGGGPTTFIYNQIANQSNQDFWFNNSNSIVYGNKAMTMLDHSSGSASFSSSTSVTLNHLLYKAPTVQQIVLTSAGNSGMPWITNIGPTQFTINTATAFTGAISWSIDLAR